MNHQAKKLFHSSIRIGGSKVVYIDPWQIPGEPHDADLILVTHEHHDHYSPEDIAKISNNKTTLVVPANMEKLGIAGAEYVEAGREYSFCGIPVKTVAAYNVGRPFHPKENGNVGYLVCVDGITYYIAGDTDKIPENEVVVCDVALVPAGGKYTMDAVQAAELVNAIRPKVAIPTHYGTVTDSGDAGEVFRTNVAEGIEVEIQD